VARTEERRRHDTLMAQLMQRIPELEASQRTEQPREEGQDWPEYFCYLLGSPRGYSGQPTEFCLSKLTRIHLPRTL
jgi:hypothetical protein